MKHLFCCIMVALPLVAFGAPLEKVEERVDWPAFMQCQDPVWEVFPQDGYESAFLGNGQLGLMVYRERGTEAIRLETGNSAVHDHRAFRGLYGRPRLLTGHFLLHPKGKIRHAQMRLDLWNAQAVATIETTEGEVKLTAYVHANEQVMAVRMESAGGEAPTVEWVPAEAESPRLIYSRLPQGRWMQKSVPKGLTPNPSPEVDADAEGGTSLQRLAAGGETAVCWQMQADGRTQTLWASIAHTYPQAGAVKEARRAVDKAVRRGWNRMLQSHEAWWHEFYPKSFLSLSDGVKENFYWIQLYKLASATRADRPLIDNCGPWLMVTPWPAAWWNLNVQLTYWPLNASNHLELAASLENALYDNMDTLRSNLPHAYRKDAYGMGRTSDDYCASEIVKIPGKDKNAEIGLLTWACHNLWLIYRHKMDDRLLRRKLVPLLRGAVNYYMNFLERGEDGYLHLPPTYSPEYGSAPDCNFDLALLRWGFQTLVESCARLGIDDPLLPRWREVLAELTPYPQDENGLLIGRGVPYASSHRHYSHMLAAYPLHLLDVGREADRDLIERSLAHWQSKPQYLQGYSYTGASSISALLGKGDEALRYLDGLFSSFLSCTTMYRESGPVIETPLSAAKAMQDMLLQSWGGKLRVFPAVPSAWPEVAFHRWLAEGAFEVSARRSAGHTAFVRIRSLKGEPCTVVTDVQSPVFSGSRRFRVERLGNNAYRLDLKRGEEVIVSPSDGQRDFSITPVDNHMRNYFGKKAK